MTGERLLPRLTPIPNGVEHANFSEQRGTKSSKAARGTWNKVWSGFDKRAEGKGGCRSSGGERRCRGRGYVLARWRGRRVT